MPPRAAQFIAEATERLTPLAERHGYTLGSAEEDWQAEVTLRRPDSTIRVTYGDRELIGNVVVSRRGGRPWGATAEYALWEWLEALDVAEAPATCLAWLQTPERVSDFVRDVAQALDLHLPAVLAGGPQVLARLEASRAARQAYERDLMARRELDSVAARAAQAFWSRRYEQVVELLEPFAARLGPADARKLDYAKRHGSQHV